ncbi:STAS domain-containing protein [Actinomadura roseirufa]|uniref:STAS domain-containing protein n=1 Tax=Actinomadura roseirufa TaxID=2094049 RepID=UPI0010411365|nr:STAS domain-containing protein [Actinomadura roseirufa]
MSGCAVTCRAEGARTVIALEGDLSLPDVQRAEHEIRAGRRAHGEHLVFDLSPLDFLDSSGLSLLLRFYLAAEGRGGSAALAGPVTERVARVLQVTNLDQRLTIHPSLRAALDAPPPGAGRRPGARADSR